MAYKPFVPLKGKDVFLLIMSRQHDETLDYTYEQLGFKDLDAAMERQSYLKERYQVIEEDVNAEGDLYNFTDLSSSIVVEDTETADFYRISWTHDSWTDGDILDSSPRVKPVSKVEKTITVYE